MKLQTERVIDAIKKLAHDFFFSRKEIERIVDDTQIHQYENVERRYVNIDNTITTRWSISKMETFRSFYDSKLIGGTTVIFALNPNGFGYNYRHGIKDDMNRIYEYSFLYSVLHRFRKIFKKDYKNQSLLYVPRFVHDYVRYELRFDGLSAICFSSDVEYSDLVNLYLMALNAAYANGMKNIIFSVSCFKYNDYITVADAILHLVELEFKGCFRDVVVVSPDTPYDNTYYELNQIINNTINELRGGNDNEETQVKKWD